MGGATMPKRKSAFAGIARAGVVLLAAGACLSLPDSVLAKENAAYSGSTTAVAVTCPSDTVCVQGDTVQCGFGIENVSGAPVWGYYGLFAPEGWPTTPLSEAWQFPPQETLRVSYGLVAWPSVPVGTKHISLRVVGSGGGDGSPSCGFTLGVQSLITPGPVLNDRGNVVLRWGLGRCVDSVEVTRRAVGMDSAVVLRRPAMCDSIVVIDGAMTPGREFAYTVRALRSAGWFSGGEVSVSIPPLPSSLPEAWRLLGASYRGGVVTLRFGGTPVGPFAVKLYDVSGRLIASVPACDPVGSEITFAARLRPGIYMARVSTGGAGASTRVVVM